MSLHLGCRLLIFWIFKHHLFVLFPVLLSLAITWTHYHVVSLTMDGVTYLQIARNILAGKGLGWQALWAPPLHSILVAAGSYLGRTDNLLAVASMVAALLGVLLVPTVYFLACQVFDRKAALAAALLTAVSPHLLWISKSPEAEITYTFFLTLSLAFFALMIRRNALFYAVPTGFCFALAYLARSEGFLILLLVMGAVLAMRGGHFYRSRLFGSCLLTLAVFTLAAAPYLLFLKKNYGSWVISPKSSYVMTWMKTHTYQDTKPPEESIEELWGLNHEGKLRWQEPKGIGDLLDFLAADPGKSMAVYLRNLPHEIPGRIPNNSGMEGYPQVFPVYFALAALAAVFMRWEPDGRMNKGVLIAPLLIMLVLPVFTDGWWKYLVPYLPVVIILAAKGFTGGAGYLAARLNRSRSKRVETATLLIVVAAIAGFYSSVLYARPQSVQSATQPTLKSTIRAEQEKAGEYGLQLIGPGRNIMIQWSPLVYYLKGFWVARPVANIRELIAYARRNNVDYVVVDIQNPAITVKDMLSWPGLRAVGFYESSTTPLKVGFYRIDPDFPAP